MSVLRIITISFLSICAPTGIISNIVVLTVFYQKRDSHDCSYVFFIHLALVDLLLCTGGLITGIGINKTGRFIFCKGGLLIIALFYCLSSGTLCLMTYDRYIYISKPLKYFRKMTPKHAKTLIGVLWGISIVNILPVLTNIAFIRRKGPFHDLDTKNCVLSKIINIPYFAWLETVFIIFLIVTIVHNFRILACARRQSRKIETTMISQNITDHHSEGNAPAGTTQLENSRGTLKSAVREERLHKNVSNRFAKLLLRVRQQKYIKTIICIVFVHCICNLPYFVIITSEIVYGYFDYSKTKYAYLLYLLNYLNSVLNPLIYTSLNSSLRKSVKKVLCSCCKRA